MDKLERRVGKFAKDYLGALGFSFDKIGDFYRRNQDYGFDAIFITNHGGRHPCAKMGSTSAIVIFCAIRLDKIEVPLNTLGLFHGEENQVRTPTLTMGFPRGTNVCPPVVANDMSDDDALRGVEELKSLTTEIFLPFFNKFSSGAAIEELANSKPLIELGPYSVGGPIEHRAMRGLILAKIENPGRYETVRKAFVDLDKGMFPRERRMAMLSQVDQMAFA